MEVIASSQSRPVGSKDWNATEVRKLLITREQVEGAQEHKTSCAVLSSQQFLVDLCQSHVQKSRISFPIAQNEVKTQGYAQLGRSIWSVFLMRLLPCCFRGRASLSWEVALVLIAGSPGFMCLIRTRAVSTASRRGDWTPEPIFTLSELKMDRRPVVRLHKDIPRKCPDSQTVPIW